MNNLSLDSQMEIISVHVHKTAGSTFGRALKQVYGEMQVFGDYQPEKFEKTLERLSAQPQSRVIHGHFAAGKYKGHFPSAKRVIWLRNPIIQFISGYFFWKSQPQKNFFSQEHKYMVENNISLLEFAEIQAKKGINPLADFYCLDVDLTDFYFIGIQEFFQDDLAKLKQMLGWPEFKMEVFNQNKYPNYREHLQKALADKSTMKRLTEITSKDMELYQKALDMRAKRQGLSSSFQQYDIALSASRQKLSQVQAKLEQNRCIIANTVTVSS
ncbi:sulfotransferase family 2 domain-containing protein [Microcoleus sp. A003_D6]|uniref:sulfotransferase family 2 domain-containing protein n=1 Tax=Microcoleus sp. A003_D6 TaxID=3055266 RepID=UPI002FD4DE34